MPEQRFCQGQYYALLASVGDYSRMDAVSLPSYQMDADLIRHGLIQGLKFEEGNIRTLGEDGHLTAGELASSMADFRRMLRGEETFVLYFSGHGKSNALIFSDMGLALQSVLEVVDRLPARSKIVILDCCCSGDFHTDGPRRLSFKENIASFAGRGIAILASTAADSVARLGPGGNHSLYTGILSAAMRSPRLVRKGSVSLQSIHEEARFLMDVWNQQNPARSQYPIFRSSMGGTIWFQIEEVQLGLPQKIYCETKRYIICSAEPLGASDMKRLRVFVILKQNNGLSELPEITREIAETVKWAEVFPEKTILRLGSGPARAVWCYFGRDQSDISRSRYLAHTVWASDEEARRLYYKETRRAHIIDEILICEHPDYERLRGIQQPVQSREDYIEGTRKLLGSIVTLAEEFIAAVQEVANRTITAAEVTDHYSEWIREVKRQYLRLTGWETPPDDLCEWIEETENLAGCILDMAMLLQTTTDDRYAARDQWLVRQAVHRYYESLEKMAALEPDE